MAGHVIGQICTENFPNSIWSYGFTIMILMVQYLMPLVLLPIVHSKILIFLRRNAGFQNDARRKEREMKRNRRMTKTLSSISVIFAISWLPYHLYLILTDIFLFQDGVSWYFDEKKSLIINNICRDIIWFWGFVMESPWLPFSPTLWCMVGSTPVSAQNWKLCYQNAAENGSTKGNKIILII